MAPYAAVQTRSFCACASLCFRRVFVRSHSCEGQERRHSLAATVSPSLPQVFCRASQFRDGAA
eukprot:3041869-Lingulodinium_polyedra.AAC.1